MTDVVITPIGSGYNLSKINSNFVALQTTINNDVVHSVGGNNVMNQDLDMNNHALLNLDVNLSDPDSVLTVAAADERYYNVDGDVLAGPMDVAGNTITGLTEPLSASSPVRKTDLDTEKGERVAADAALSNIIAGSNPAAAQFATISWHAQVIPTSVTIPPAQNAWSFGPALGIAVGQVVTISPGSFWTIANGTLV